MAAIWDRIDKLLRDRWPTARAYPRKVRRFMSRMVTDYDREFDFLSDLKRIRAELDLERMTTPSSWLSSLGESHSGHNDPRSDRINRKLTAFDAELDLLAGVIESCDSYRAKERPGG